MARITPPAMRLLRSDPFAPLVAALEVFDDSTQTATPAGLLSERVVAPRAPRLGADSRAGRARDLPGHPRPRRPRGDRTAARREPSGRARASSASSSTTTPAPRPAGRRQPSTSPATCASSSTTPAQAAERPRARGQRRRARAGAARRPRASRRSSRGWAPRGSTPTPTGSSSPSCSRTHRSRSSIPAARSGRSGQHRLACAATSEWGTGRMPAPALAKAVLEQRPIQVTDEIDDGERTRRVVNPTETAAAQEKAHAMQERFAEWCWEEPDRAAAARRRVQPAVQRARAARLQRRRAAADAARAWRARSPRDAPARRRRADARRARRRAVSPGRRRQDRRDGDRRDASCGASAWSESPPSWSRTTCSSSSPANGLQLYPQARILAASGEDLAGEKRRAFVARAAANDWDAIIMTRSAFERIPVVRRDQSAYAERELERAASDARTRAGRGGLTVKRLEKLVLAAEERLQERLDGRGPGAVLRADRDRLPDRRPMPRP